MVQPLWKTVWRRFLKKLKVKLSYNLAIPLLGIFLKKNIIQKIHAPQCSLQHYLQQLRHGSNLYVSRQMNKGVVVHINNRILLSYLKKRTHLSQL